MLTQRCKDKKVREHASVQEREKPLALWLFLYVLFSPWACPM